MRTLPFDYSVRNLGRSLSRLALSICGSLLVVLLLLAAGAFVRGMEVALISSGEPNNVMLLGSGSEESTERSEVDTAVADMIAASVPGIRSRAGVDYVSPEIHAQLPLRSRENQPKPPLAFVRGVTLQAFLVHRQVRLAEGEFPRPGRNEVMVGSMVATKLGVTEADVEIGKTLWIDKGAWIISGRLSAPGTVIDGEVWATRADLQEATKRTTDSCVIVTLDPQQAEFSDVALFTKMRVDLELAAVTEVAYYARLSQFFGPIRMLAWVTAGLIAMGGLLGGLNTIYAAFASRVRELGTLQACGFRRSAVALSLVQESVLITACGALIACTLAVSILDGICVRFSMGVFGLRVDGYVLTLGLCAGLLLGIVGALPPAWRCLRLEIPVALKSV